MRPSEINQRERKPQILLLSYNNVSNIDLFKLKFTHDLVPPSIKYITPNTTVNETDDVTLFCNSTGNPAPNITWVLLDDLDAGIRGTQESLTLSHVKRNQSGTYGCFADNGVMGRRNDSVHVTINCE